MFAQLIFAVSRSRLDFIKFTHSFNAHRLTIFFVLPAIVCGKTSSRTENNFKGKSLDKRNHFNRQITSIGISAQIDKCHIFKTSPGVWSRWIENWWWQKILYFFRSLYLVSWVKWIEYARNRLFAPVRTIPKCVKSKLNAFTSENTLNYSQYYSYTVYAIFQFFLRLLSLTCVRVCMLPRLFFVRFTRISRLFRAWPSFIGCMHSIHIQQNPNV